MKTLENQLQEFLGIDPKPLSDKVKKFYRLSIDDCLNFTEKAINDKLKEYHKEKLAANEDIGEAFEEEFGCRSDYFNHRVGLFNDMKNWIVKKYKSKT